MFRGYWIWVLAGFCLPVITNAAADADLLTSEQWDRNDLIQAVFARNPGIDALREAETAAVARIEPAGALDDPMLSTSVAPRQYDSRGMADRGFNLEISQALPWPGKLADRAETARAESRVAGTEIEILKLKLRELAASAYAEWVFVEQALAINTAHQKHFEELRSVAEARYSAGRGAQQDVLQADVENRLLDKRAFELKRQRAELRARINGLLNREPDRPLPEPVAPGAPDKPQPFSTLADLARNSHPELILIEHRIGGRKARVELAEKEFYPDFRVSAGYNSMWNDPRHRPMIGVAINVPLDQSKRQAALNAAKADLREIEWRLIDRRSQLLSELESARAAVIESVETFELYRKQLLPLAGDSLDAAIADYTGGRGDFLNVINAEHHKLTTELGRARALADYHRHLARLESAVGKSLAHSQTTTSPSVDDVSAVTRGDFHNE